MVESPHIITSENLEEFAQTFKNLDNSSTARSSFNDESSTTDVTSLIAEDVVDNQINIKSAVEEKEKEPARSSSKRKNYQRKDSFIDMAFGTLKKKFSFSRNRKSSETKVAKPEQLSRLQNVERKRALSLSSRGSSDSGNY